MRRALAPVALVAALALGGLVVAAGGARAQGTDAGAGSATGGATGSGSGSAIYVDPGDVLGAPEVTAAAMPSEVELAAPFTLVITAVYDPGVTVNLPSRIDLAPVFEERRRTSTDRKRADGKLIREWQIQVIAWELGELSVPPIQVTFVRGGVASATETSPVPVRVVGALGDMVDTTEPRADAPPVPLMRRTWFWVFLIPGVTLALIGAALLLGRRRKPRPGPLGLLAGTTTSKRRIGGPAAEALARLEAIDSSGMLARDRKVAYTEMVDVLQTFLARQYAAPLEDATSGELRRWLADARMPASARLGLSRWLEDCDLVKFGGLAATVEDGRGHLVQARDLVLAIATSPAAAVAAATAADAADRAAPPPEGGAGA
ncbi:MAG: hypothetical protein H6708_29885 [Kofleriaceae bacterium]|nr:hypothetical protein [Kofleriaceae bacterium]